MSPQPPAATADMLTRRPICRSQALYTESDELAMQMLTRVRQGAQKYQGKELTGSIDRPPFTYVLDKSPARDANPDSFEIKPGEGIVYVAPLCTTLCSTLCSASSHSSHLLGTLGPHLASLGNTWSPVRG